MGDIKLMLIEDHNIVREGIKRLLEVESNLKVVAEAGTKQEAMKKLNKDIDIILLDIKLPDGDGLDLCEKITAKVSDVKFIALTTYDDPIFVKKAREQGVHGFIPKHASYDEIKSAINAVIRHGKYMYPGLETDINSNETILTEVEIQILNLIANGENQNDIAEQLFMSLSTLRRRLKGICTKLGVTTTEEALAQAAKKGLIQ